MPKLTEEDLEALRKKVEGDDPSWCIECQKEVKTNDDDWECPTCGDETVPMIGHGFLNLLYEAVKD